MTLFNTRLLCMFASVLIFSSMCNSPWARAESPYAACGGMVGEVTSNSALIQVRLSAVEELQAGDVPGTTGIVRFELREKGASKSVSQTVRARADRDFIARAAFAALKPGTTYLCDTMIGKDEDRLKVGPAMQFTTHAGADREQLARFVVVTGMNYAKFHGDDRIDRKLHVKQNNTELPEPFSGTGKQLGYPALESIRKLKPDFFIGTGDNVYYDTPVKGRAETIDAMRRKWHEQFVQQRYVELFQEVPTYWEFDDHDYRVDDCDNTGDYAPLPKLGERLIREQLPVTPAELDDAPLYRTHRVTKDLQIWLVENRLNRSPNRAPDGPEKTIWGSAQKAWLKRTLQESDATFKLLISPTPMIGPDDLRKKDNHTNTGGFRHEGEEFFDWLQVTGIADEHFYILCGDRHWQYHSIHPSGLQEFSCGALVDANSRLGRKPGDPKSTDPDALIKQAYSQDPASGGFLLVEVAPRRDSKPATLTFQFMDENGRLLHKHQIAANAASSQDRGEAIPLIFDTDMMGDVDDVGSVALLHALAAQNEVDILAMGLSGKNRWSPLCLDALNVYFQRPGIPIGAVRGPAFDRKSKYAESVAKEFPRRLQSLDDTPDAAKLYRKVLANQPNGKTVMVSVGQLTNFANLLKTGPDEYSNLAGSDLVRQKVRVWVCMGGKIPAGREANLIHDGAAAAYAVQHWPTPIIFSGYEIGNKIMTGKRLVQLPKTSPVRRAYELYNGLTDRQSWDQTAVLYAARGLDGGLDQMWEVHSRGFLHVNPDGSNQWRESPDNPHSYLVEKMQPQKIADAIELLMMFQPAQ